MERSGESRTPPTLSCRKQSLQRTSLYPAGIIGAVRLQADLLQRTFC